MAAGLVADVAMVRAVATTADADADDANWTSSIHDALQLLSRI